jgi:cytochrome P450
VKEEKFIENKVRFLGQGVAFAEGHEWSRRRKIMASIFHFSFFNKFIPKITDIVDREIAQIRGHDKYSFQAQDLSALISGDTIVKTFFGIAFNEKIEDESISVWFGRLIADTVTQERSLRYFLFGLKLLEAGLLREDRSVNRRIALFKALAKDLIEKRLAEQPQEEGTVLQAIHERGLLNAEDGYTVEQLIDEFMVFFVAGTDTTAHLMTMCFYYLALYPAHQDALRAEIQLNKLFENFEFRLISGLKFLDAFVKETFRHYNYMVSTFPRVCVRTHTLADMTINEGYLSPHAATS